MRQQGGGPSAARPFWPALDGLRALAVTLVLFHHLGGAAFPEGGIGVDVFFVLSGFLITTVIVTEWRTTDGSFGFRRFYIRRALRLVPALAVTLLGVIAVFVVADLVDDRALAADTLAQVPAAGTYTLNWFMAWGGWAPTALTHTWSLAVEEQFYLVWPVVVVAVLRWRGPRAALAVTIASVVGLFALGALEIRLTGDYSRVYFATEYRMPQMLAGATLALLLVGVGGRRTPGRWTAGVGAAAVIAIVAMAQRSLDVSKIEYLKLPIITALAATVVWAMVVAGDAAVFRPFLVRPVQWVGRRSYGIYLFHLPILLAMARAGWSVEARAAVGIPAVLVLAALSWRVVETPALRLKERFELAAPGAGRDTTDAADGLGGGTGEPEPRAGAR